GPPHEVERLGARQPLAADADSRRSALWLGRGNSRRVLRWRLRPHLAVSPATPTTTAAPAAARTPLRRRLGGLDGRHRRDDFGPGQRGAGREVDFELAVLELGDGEQPALRRFLTEAREFRHPEVF